MKIRILLFLAVCGLSITSCSKDEDPCEAESLEAMVVGEYDLEVLGQNQGEFEFKEDGTLIDTDDIVIGGEINGVVLDEKSYIVVNDSTLEVEARNGTLNISAVIDVIAYECDAMTWEVFGVEAQADKK